MFCLHRLLLLMLDIRVPPYAADGAAIILCFAAVAAAHAVGVLLLLVVLLLLMSVLQMYSKYVDVYISHATARHGWSFLHFASMIKMKILTRASCQVSLVL